MLTRLFLNMRFTHFHCCWCAIFQKVYTFCTHTHSLIFVAPLEWNWKLCSSFHMANHFECSTDWFFFIHSKWASCRNNLLDLTRRIIELQNLSSLTNSEFRVHSWFVTQSSWGLCLILIKMKPVTVSKTVIIQICLSVN